LGKKILLTGHEGFIGSFLEPELVKRGYQVLKPKLNIKKYAKMERWISQNKPDYVIHIASTNSIKYSYDHYIDVIETNFVATANIAEACRKLRNFKQFIFASSSEVYGNATTKGKFKEDSKLSPNSPHAVSKIASEIYLEHLGRLYGFPYTILRLSNTYGRRKTSNYFVEGIITRMLSNKPVTIENPNAIRDFLFVDDHVAAYLKALGNGKALMQTINICTGVGHTTSYVARNAAKLIKFKGTIVENKVPKRPNEAKLVIGDNSKAKKLLNWAPKYDINDGLNATIKYWKLELKN
jgi:UDP-glucose 4-epimerase